MGPPPDLIDDAIAEILLRLPPDEPACLTRAAAVCKPWRRVVSDPGFSRRYREFHGTPPLLGFLHNTSRHGYVRIPRFVPIRAAIPFPQQVLEDSNWWIGDCRHGRVLVQQPLKQEYVVWDPITGNREELRRPPDTVPFLSHTVAVMCAVPGCNHGGCHGGPFIVIFMCTDGHGVHLCAYSSETHAWGTPISLPGNGCLGFDPKRGAFIARDNVYYSNIMYEDKIVIAKYELGNHSLSTIDPPDHNYNSCSLLIPNEDGSLGLAGIKDSKLYLWSRMMNTQGSDEWIQRRVVKLNKLLIPIFNSYCNRVYVSGFAEGAGFIYLTTINHVFMLELKSGRMRKASELREQYAAIFPFMSFYTPDYANGNYLSPLKAQ